MLQLKPHENNNIPRDDICLFIFVEQCFMSSVFDVSSISTLGGLGWGVSLLCGVIVPSIHPQDSVKLWMYNAGIGPIFELFINIVLNFR